MEKRRLQFGSPRRLNLRLCCAPKSPVRDMGIWPALPLFIRGYIVPTPEGKRG
jgi:hypothetical protein